MAHQRKLIRDAVVKRLKEAGTSAGDRIYPNRARPLMGATFPVILVYAVNDSSEIFNESPREYRRSLKLGIELIVEGDDEVGIEDALDDLAEKVEKEIFSEETFGGRCEDTILGETEMHFDAGGKRLMGLARINLVMPYYQSFPAEPATALAEFKTADTKMDPDSSDETDHEETEDSVTLPQP